jgi:predicted helicase
MSVDIRTVKDMNGLITYLAEKLSWRIDLDDFEDIEDIAYDFEAEDIGLKEEAFVKIQSLRQLPPLVDGQKWGIFCVEFDSKKFEVTALRKILSGLIPKRRNSADHAVWDQKDLLFICFWGSNNERTIGLAHFEDIGSGLPQIKMISCYPAVEDFTQIRVFEERLKNLKWPTEFVDHTKWREDWSSAFTTGYKQTIRDASTLTVQLAAEAQGIKNRILDILEVETSTGYVHLLYDKFKSTLIHDMTETQFADMYAQTVVYGLFSARCMDRTQDDFSASEAVDCIPNTNPFLKSLMRECLEAQNNSKLSFDELEIGNVVDLLLHTKTDAIIQDFNRQTGGGREDPVIHFYEEFLTEYDKTQKVQRGVYYTPQPVVNFIVRAVDHIIKTDFGYGDGLAATDMKKIKYLRQSKKRYDGYHYKIIEDTVDVPAIQVLDPSTGTGTFIRQTILQIYSNFKEKNRGLSADELNAKWNEYVPMHLLPRVNAFELMMAPYAVAHMKLAMVLQNTGYQFNDNSRLNVFLANTLEEPGSSDRQLTLWDDPLATESIEANAVKKNIGINIVLGNPPYSGESANKGAWIMNLMETYKKEPGGQIKLQERNPKWLNDDYVKFIRFAQHVIETSGEGILSYICPHGFIDNPTFRGMRWSMLHTFDTLYVIDLHGNAKKKETCPDGSKDENVFDIQQGVCILIAVKKSKKTSLADVYHADLFGLRADKYSKLNALSLEKVDFTKVNLVDPQYFFVPKDFSLAKEYSDYVSVDSIFTVKSVGVVSAKDKILIDRDADALVKKVEEYYGKKAEKERVESIAYRPFDDRKIYYDVSLLERPREEIMSNMRAGKRNFGLCVTKVIKAGNTYQNCFVSDKMIDSCFVSNRTSEITYMYPLFTYAGSITVENIDRDYIKKLEGILRIPFKKGIGGDTDRRTFCAINVLEYVYAILHWWDYREKYIEFLKIDYPKIPYPKDAEEFFYYALKGRELIDIHTMLSIGDTSRYSVEGAGDNSVLSPSYKDNAVYINKKKLISGVEEKDWDFDIGAYKPLQKWLKDRNKQILSAGDIEHYKRIIAAVNKTRNIMESINKHE